MTIMEPRATYWRIIATRSLLQFLDIAWAWGPRSFRWKVGGTGIGQHHGDELAGNVWSGLDALLQPDHLAHFLIEPFRFDAGSPGRISLDRVCPYPV